MVGNNKRFPGINPINQFRGTTGRSLGAHRFIQGGRNRSRSPLKNGRRSLRRNHSSRHGGEIPETPQHSRHVPEAQHAQSRRLPTNSREAFSSIWGPADDRGILSNSSTDSIRLGSQLPVPVVNDSPIEGAAEEMMFDSNGSLISDHIAPSTEIPETSVDLLGCQPIDDVNWTTVARSARLGSSVDTTLSDQHSATSSLTSNIREYLAEQLPHTLRRLY
ncbi:uncharacterized protein EAF01_009885 [Botrytis porri]|uniref:uncharacterized protein n=1 Tax=Botrytis porri TaxID=87229 RepID=UPI0019006F89|nr:uncharacterized protein EAF01_009885 [Botrytis porri]KAF7894434.1 hypothetical protein EAF01_009885 [Botrytis porri]